MQPVSIKNELRDSCLQYKSKIQDFFLISGINLAFSSRGKTSTGASVVWKVGAVNESSKRRSDAKPDEVLLCRNAFTV